MKEREKVFSVTAKDVEWQTFRAGGKGGQNQNKRDTGVRCKHVQSGAVSEARDQRSQLQNKRSAFRRMAQSDVFKTWARLTALKLRPIDDIVDEMMRPENLRVDLGIHAGG